MEHRVYIAKLLVTNVLPAIALILSLVPYMTYNVFGGTLNRTQPSLVLMCITHAV